MPVDNLRADVVNSTAIGVSRLRGMDGPSEIRQFYDIIFAEKYVFRLQVSMNDVHVMQVLHGADHLRGVLGHHFLFKLPDLSKHAVEFAPSGILQNDIYFFLIEEEPIHLYNIVMLDVAVYFNFSSDLTDYI